MKFGIISDTHDHHRNVVKAIDVFNQYEVDYVLHAGDIVSPFTARAFKDLEHSRFIAVYGNNDGEKLFLKNTINSFGGEIHEYCFKGELADKKIYMSHVHHNIKEVVKSGFYDLIIYGHTHIQDIRRENGAMVINPGETTDWVTGNSSIVILDSDNMEYQVIGLK